MKSTVKTMTEKTLTADSKTSAPSLPLPDVSHLDPPSALARKLVVDRILRDTRGDVARKSERDVLKRESAALSNLLRDAQPPGAPNSNERCHRKYQDRRGRTPAFFAGLKSALHDAIVARLDPALVVELEQDALNRLVEIWRKNNERRKEQGLPLQPESRRA